MIVMISNKLKGIVEESRLNEMGCKYTVGCFSVEEYIRNLQNYDFDYLIVDITAIKDVTVSESWQKLKKFFDPNKTIILLENEKFYSNEKLLTMLFTAGFYNFTKTADEILHLMEHPNDSNEVAKYLQMSTLIEEGKGIDKTQDYQKQVELSQAMMMEYLENHENEGDVLEKKENVLKFQLSVGLIILPILTFVCVLVFYLLQVLVSNSIPLEGDYLGEYLYGELANTGFTPLTLIGIILCMLIFSMYYSFLNAKIRRKQMSRVKFMVIPFALYVAIMFGEYYFIGIFEKLYQWVMIFSIADKPYLYQDLHDLSRWIATAAIILYYLSVFVYNSKTVKFEKDLSQNLTVVEKLWVVDLLFLLLLPVSYQLSRALPQSNFISQIFNEYYSHSLMMIIVGIELVLTICIFLQPKFMKEREYTILKEEDL